MLSDNNSKINNSVYVSRIVYLTLCVQYWVVSWDPNKYSVVRFYFRKGLGKWRYLSFQKNLFYFYLFKILILSRYYLIAEIFLEFWKKMYPKILIFDKIMAVNSIQWKIKSINQTDIELVSFRFYRFRFKSKHIWSTICHWVDLTNPDYTKKMWLYANV